MPLHLMFLLIRIQIQLLLKLNFFCIACPNPNLKDSNTTLVKVKSELGTFTGTSFKDSNTTLVKVKLV